MGQQSFGQNFQLESLLKAREDAKALLLELSTLIRAGMVEADAHRLYKELSVKYGAQKQWHPAKLRFGPNTVLAFKEESIPYTLKENDIFFLDIGPVFSNHEADFGQTFVLGNDPEKMKIAKCSEIVFQEVGEYWLNHKCSGPDLYEYARGCAQKLGYELNPESDGHRIGDFPHHIHFKGSLPEVSEVIIPNAWILEIHLIDPKNNYGAFFEDILSDLAY